MFRSIIFLFGTDVIFFCIYMYSGVQHVLTLWVIWQLSYKRHTWIILRQQLGSSLIFGGVRVALYFLCSVVLFVFVLYLVCLMLPMSLGYSFLIAASVFSNVYLSCVLCAQCFQCLWIVQSWLPHRCSLTFICPVSCVTNVANVSGLFILDYPIGFL
jgi:hypothetical protein